MSMVRGLFSVIYYGIYIMIASYEEDVEVVMTSLHPDELKV